MPETDSMYRDFTGYETYSPLSKEGMARLRGRTARFLLKYKSKIKSPVIEIGCGGGVWIYFIETETGIPVLGIDNNPEMYRLAKESIKQFNLTSSVVLGDAKKYEPSSSVGTVLFLGNIIHDCSISDFDRILRTFEEKMERELTLFVEYSESIGHAFRQGRKPIRWRSPMGHISERIIDIGSDGTMKRELKNLDTGKRIIVSHYLWSSYLLGELFRIHDIRIVDKARTGPNTIISLWEYKG